VGVWVVNPCSLVGTYALINIKSSFHWGYYAMKAGSLFRERSWLRCWLEHRYLSQCSGEARIFGETCRRNFQDGGVSQVRKRRSRREADNSFWNIRLSPDYKALQHTRPHSSYYLLCAMWWTHLLSFVICKYSVFTAIFPSRVHQGTCWISVQYYIVFRSQWPAALTKAWTVFARSNAGIVGSNSTQGTDICSVCLCFVFVLFCV
jgi:hypothetical protein